MLKHFVIFKFQEHFIKQEHISEFIQAFEEIKKNTPGVLDTHIRANCISRPANMDLMIEMDLKDESVLNDYLACPIHIQMCKKYDPYVTNRISFDYMISDIKSN